jgi:hypothetical protein
MMKITEEPILTVDEQGTKVWRVGKYRHRIGGPAVIHPNGSEVWWVGGQRHRIDGPAVVRSDKPEKSRYYLYGKEVTRKVIGLKENGLTDEQALNFILL